MSRVSSSVSKLHKILFYILLSTRSRSDSVRDGRLAGDLHALALKRGITLFAIDEAHCVSKWGHDFRPEYGQLGILRSHFRDIHCNGKKIRIPIMALTATATCRVREDVLHCLGLHESRTKIILSSFYRPNLIFSVTENNSHCFLTPYYCHVISSHVHSVPLCESSVIASMYHFHRLLLTSMVQP